jgi:hypothetical protein
VTVVTDPPVVGAALLAMDALEAGTAKADGHRTAPDTEETLREALRRAPESVLAPVRTNIAS